MNKKNITTVTSWALWLGLLILTHLGYVWAENIAIFLVFILAAIVFIIFFAMVNAPTGGYKGSALAAPFDSTAYLQVEMITLFFVARGQFWPAGAGTALVVFMVGVNGQIDRQREENNAKIRQAGERGH